MLDEILIESLCKSEVHQARTTPFAYAQKTICTIYINWSCCEIEHSNISQLPTFLTSPKISTRFLRCLQLIFATDPCCHGIVCVRFMSLHPYQYLGL